MERCVDFGEIRSFGDWLDCLSPRNQFALAETYPDLSEGRGLNAGDVLDAVISYRGGIATKVELVFLLADVFGWT